MSAPVRLGYNRTQILLHWIVVALIIVQFISGDSMGAVGRALSRSLEPDAMDALLSNFHIWLGITVGVLAVARLVLRFTRGAPALPENENVLLKLVAHIVHVGLYICLFAMPLTGVVAWFGGVELAEEMHEILKPVLILLVALHVIGALYQHYGLKTDVLKRMMRPE